MAAQNSGNSERVQRKWGTRENHCRVNGRARPSSSPSGHNDDQIKSVTEENPFLSCRELSLITDINYELINKQNSHRKTTKISLWRLPRLLLGDYQSHEPLL